MKFTAPLQPIPSIAAAVLLFTLSATADNIYVPGDYNKIQDAIDNAAYSGDTIIVADGAYHENIRFYNTAVIVRHDGSGDAVIDGDPLFPNTPLVQFVNGEGPGSVLDGFVLANGSSTLGAGIKISNAEPIIRNCKIQNCSASQLGGAVYIWSSSPYEHPRFEDCVFTGNDAGSGGAVSCDDTDVTFEDCEFIGNTAQSMGGGVVIWDDCEVTFQRCEIRSNSCTNGNGGGLRFGSNNDVSILNCWIQKNRAASGAGGGVFSDYKSDTVYRGTTFSENSALTGGGFHVVKSTQSVENCIFWDNVSSLDVGHQMAIYGTVSAPMILDVSYSDVEGGEGDVSAPPPAQLNWLAGSNIDTDPNFVNQAAGDLQLRSNSLCIDAGDPNYVAADGEMDIKGDSRVWIRADMGGDERGVLVCDKTFLSPSGGTVTFQLDAGLANGGNRYLMAGSLSGIHPGYWHQGTHYVPLFFDDYTTLTLGLQPPFEEFWGYLDQYGRATVELDVPDHTVVPVGLTFHHAFVALEPGVGVTFANNACAFEFDRF